MSLALIFGIGFAVIAVCLAALCLFDRQRFWSITEPKYHVRHASRIRRPAVPQEPLNRYQRVQLRAHDWLGVGPSEPGPD